MGLMNQLPEPGAPISYNLFMSYGELESYSYFGEPLAEFIPILEARNYKDFHLHYYVTPDKDHYDVARPNLFNFFPIYKNLTN
ncbi:MAG: hypothetical protein JXJ04_22065 [Spirochaetales bacterium]|nr:hypothetical protein [Spirochaetales bacterium]